MTFDVLQPLGSATVLIIILISIIVVQAFFLAVSAKIAYGLKKAKLSKGLMQWGILFVIQLVTIIIVTLISAIVMSVTS